MPDRFSLLEVKYLPDEIDDGILYYSESFSIAAHKCACGCCGVVYTPVKKGEWSIKVESVGPSLSPSIGNWNLPCKSHYWIRRGTVAWASEWSQERIEAGRELEEQTRLRLHGQNADRDGVLSRAIKWFRQKFLR